MLGRFVVATALVVSGLGAAVTAVPAVPAEADAESRSRADARSGRGFDEPYQGFAPRSTQLRPAQPEEAGLNGAHLSAMLDELRGFLEPSVSSGRDHPLYPGAVVLGAREGSVVLHEAMGHALRYADAEGTELPEDERVPMTEDTIFDMASVSKLFTSIVVMQQVELGRIDLEAPVASYLPKFAAHGKEDVTVQQLLTHTSGLPAWLPLWREWPDRASRIEAALEVEPQAPPGTRYTYSDLNLITLGVLVQRVSGKPLDVLVREGITAPLGMVDTGYNPDPSTLHRIAATEFQSEPARGMVRGSVHDENAWSLGGVAGHAGIFSTADDMAKLCQAMLNGGTYDGAQILSRESTAQMLVDYNSALPGHAHGLGFELDQRWYMGGLTSPQTAGHTGYTGTSIVIDPMSRSFVILLTNRVHPRREWSSVNAARRVVATRFAQAIGVTPRRGDTAWFAGNRNDHSATLAVPVELRGHQTRAAFQLFVDTEETDILTLEVSRDGGASWEPVPFVMWSRGRLTEYDEGHIFGFTGRHWQHGYAELGDQPGRVVLRWRYVTDPAYQGRGVYLDAVRIADTEGVLLDGEKQPDRFEAAGWQLARR